MAKSRISNTKVCRRCGTTWNIEKHHLLNGPYRDKSDEDGLWIYLCEDCHILTHHSPILRNYKRYAQKIYEKEIGDREQFRKRYGKSYL